MDDLAGHLHMGIWEDNQQCNVQMSIPDCGSPSSRNHPKKGAQNELIQY